MWERVVGVLFLLLGVWQMVVSKRYGHHVTKHGDAATSPFSLLALADSFYIGIMFVGLGIATFFMQF
ncbi:hypothetical protein ACFQ3L_02665 [Lacticaseibacillus jixianensis]|uniref:Uncharacterized protein n=1 Tax=Lacticaseibacillus jixianensis TaxID=2486012 RepID=A0ABW4B804_9LACO|nr:hypothetical protein [Lacticaseibacillus jixianensis]